MPARKIEQPVERKSFDTMSTKNRAIMVLVFAVIFFVLGALSSKTIASAMPTRNSMQTQSVESIFVDINGDGLLDLVVYADVVLNDGNSNLALGQ